MGLGIADEIDNRFIADQRLGSLVLRNEGKHPVFNLVPLAGSGWEVRYVKAESCEISQTLNSHLP